ncbi:hypothetical protein ACMD2_24322 [Ananas comosus]|uniref:Uncharacterized protein n=1 Tax=Ananas comosus TaxID=4615 RepID=A0A199V1F5_ANACO|nr:hypothetical protein ACMD2_24322 [Ananas comosus]
MAGYRKLRQHRIYQIWLRVSVLELRLDLGLRRARNGGGGVGKVVGGLGVMMAAAHAWNFNNTERGRKIVRGRGRSSRRELGSAFSVACEVADGGPGIASSLHTEDSLTASFVIAAAALSIVVYDYQEIGLLVILFCIFHACVGFILPSLAKLRSMYLPNELRGGMITLSLAPANAVILLVLINRAYNRSIENSTIMALAACGLLTAGACIHILRRWRKHPRQNWRNL